MSLKIIKYVSMCQRVRQRKKKRGEERQQNQWERETRLSVSNILFMYWKLRTEIGFLNLVFSNQGTINVSIKHR